MTRCITTIVAGLQTWAPKKRCLRMETSCQQMEAPQKWRVTKVVSPNGCAEIVAYPDGDKMSTNGDTTKVAYPNGDTEIVARRNSGLDAMRQSHYSGSDAARHRDILRARAHVRTCVCVCACVRVCAHVIPRENFRKHFLRVMVLEFLKTFFQNFYHCPNLDTNTGCRGQGEYTQC